MKTVVLTGGGTAGHCTPNVALIPYLEKYFDKTVYIGSEKGIERDIVKNLNIPYYKIPTAKLERKFTPRNLAIPVKLVSGVYKARKILKKIDPSVVFSKGGYVSLPVVIAAKSLKIPVVSHESDLSVGLANKIASRFSDVTLTAFKKTAGEIKNGRYVGTPIRAELYKKRDKNAVLKKLGLDKNKKTGLVTGGSQGADSINRAVADSLDTLTEKYNVILVCGKGKSTGKTAKNFYETEYAKDMGELMAAADACVSRAGANTLMELISLGMPTVAIPLPKGNSRGDQEENAAYLKRKKLITVLEESRLSGVNLLKKLETLEKNHDEIRERCLATDLKSGAEKIAEIIASFASGKAEKTIRRRTPARAAKQK